MRTFRPLLFVALCAAAVSTLPTAAGQDGYVSLFNGQNLDGWERRTPGDATAPKTA